MLKKILIVILILVVFLGGAYAYLYFTQEKASDGIGTGITLTDFFPFGQGDAVVNPNTQNTTNPSENIEQISTTPNQLRQIYAFPVAGAGLFNTASSTFIRFIEQSTGNLYGATTNSTLVERITNTTIPKVSEARFVTADSVLVRYLRPDTDVIETLYSTVSTTSVAVGTSTPETNEFATLKTTFLLPGIKQVEISPNKNKIFYLMEMGVGGIGTLANPNGDQKTTLISSPIREWTAQWPTTTTIALTTKPSFRAEGSLYFVNTTSGSQKKVLSGAPGLSTLTNPSLSTVAYSQNDTNGAVALYTWNVASSTATKTALAPTLADKCVWGKKNSTLLYCAVPHFIPQSNYPDTWYQGRIAFADTLWVVNTTTGETKQLVDIRAVTNRDLDVIDLSIDQNDTFLLFKNKTDSTLWGYAI